MNRLRMRLASRALLAALVAALGCTAAQAQTQAAMSEGACAEYKRSDAEMNKIYQQVLAKHKGEREFIQKLKLAQRAWVAYRDAHLESLYPKQNKAAEYGTSYSMCRCQALSAITTRRIEELKQWIAGREEGDVCAGSVKSN